MTIFFPTNGTVNPLNRLAVVSPALREKSGNIKRPKACNRLAIAIDHKILSIDHKILFIDHKILPIDHKILSIDHKILSIDHPNIIKFYP